MRLIGSVTVPVEAQAIAENVSNINVVIVYDGSGSKNDDACREGTCGPTIVERTTRRRHEIV